jgi:hypothetical protein
MDVACLAAGEDGLAAVTAAATTARAVATTGAVTAATAVTTTTAAARAVTATTTVTTTAARTAATACGHAVHAGAHRVGLRAGRCRAQAIGIAEAAGRAKAGHGVVGAALLGSTFATTAIFATVPTTVAAISTTATATATLALRTALTLV